MPASIKMKEEYGDGLTVLFVESQNTSEEKTASFILEHRWMGADTLWTNEHPFSTSSRGLPSFAVISADGKVLATGNHMGSKEKDLIEQEVKAASGPPEGTNKAFKSAWKDFSKGKYGKAIVEANKVGAKKPDLAEEAAATVEQFGKRIQSQFDSINWSIENGFAVEAQDRVSDLVKGLKGADELYASAQELEQRFESEDMELELEAGEIIGKTLEKLFEDGKDEKLFSKLEKLADKYSSTKAAVRARKIVAMQ